MIYLFFFLMFLKILFWIHNIFMVIFSGANYPFSFKLMPNYPFNNLKGHICSGNGIHLSNVTEKEITAHMMLFFGALIYTIQICYISGKTSRFLKNVSPKGSGVKFNGHFRYHFKLYCTATAQ